MKLFILLQAAFLALPFSNTTDVFDQIVAAVKTSNSKQVAQYFNKTVDFASPEAADIYSKAQAEILLKNFFAKYPPKGFTVQHRGSSAQGTRYIIGNYEYEKGSLRVYILVKEQDNVQQIQELHFEKE